MNWLHDAIVNNGIWSPGGKAQPIIAPALAAAAAATVIDASAITRFWFDRANPAFDWRGDLPTYMPFGETTFIESRAAPRVRLGGDLTARWPWRYRRFGVLLVAKDLRRHSGELGERQAVALRAIQTVESWESPSWRATAIPDDPRWGVAFYLVGDRGERAPALLGAGALAVRGDGRLAACTTPDPEQVAVAARAVVVMPEPRSEANDVLAAGTFERLLAPLLFANALMHVDNELESLDAADENDLAAAVRACRDVFVTTSSDERNTA